MREGWYQVVATPKSGMILTTDVSEGCKIEVENDHIKQAQGPIAHVRTHAARSFHRLSDGSDHVSGSPSDADETPTGELMTERCVWINDTCILSQLKYSLK